VGPQAGSKQHKQTQTNTNTQLLACHFSQHMGDVALKKKKLTYLVCEVFLSLTPLHCEVAWHQSIKTIQTVAQFADHFEVRSTMQMIFFLKFIQKLFRSEACFLRSRKWRKMF